METITTETLEDKLSMIEVRSVSEEQLKNVLFDMLVVIRNINETLENHYYLLNKESIDAQYE